jgi:hypothetical protein
MISMPVFLLTYWRIALELAVAGALSIALYGARAQATHYESQLHEATLEIGKDQGTIKDLQNAIDLQNRSLQTAEDAAEAARLKSETAVAALPKPLEQKVTLTVQAVPVGPDECGDARTIAQEFLKAIKP